MSGTMPKEVETYIDNYIKKTGSALVKCYGCNKEDANLLSHFIYASGVGSFPVHPICPKEIGRISKDRIVWDPRLPIRAEKAEPKTEVVKAKKKVVEEYPPMTDQDWARYLGFSMDAFNRNIGRK